MAAMKLFKIASRTPPGEETARETGGYGETGGYASALIGINGWLWR